MALETTIRCLIRNGQQQKEQVKNRVKKTKMVRTMAKQHITYKTMEDAPFKFHKHPDPDLDIYISDSFPTYFYNNKLSRFVHGYYQKTGNASYRRITFDSKKYPSGQLAIEAITGALLQQGEFGDHITGNTTNDWSANLRKTHACGNSLNHKHNRNDTIRPRAMTVPRLRASDGSLMNEVLESGIKIIRNKKGKSRWERPYHVYTRIGPPNKRTPYNAYFKSLEEPKEHLKVVHSVHSDPYLPN
ncbi:MAG: hypothetical protein ACI8RD_012986 [Bacillariaceae sp.]|jgi:hypothetical protein